MSTVLRELHQELLLALNGDRPYVLGVVEKRLAVKLPAKGGWFDDEFVLTEVSTIEPETGPLPHVHAYPETAAGMVDPDQSNGWGTDLGASPERSDGHMEVEGGALGQFGTFLDSRNGSGQRSSHLVEHEAADLAEVRFKGRLTDGPRIMGKAWRSATGYALLVRFYDFEESCKDFLSELFKYPYCPSLDLLELSGQRIVASTAKTRITLNGVRVRIRPGINVLCEAVPPVGVRALMSTGATPLIFFGVLPEDPAAPTYLHSAPLFSFDSEGLHLSRGYLEIRAKGSDGEDEDDAYWEARVQLRGTLAVGEATVAMSAPLVAGDQLLVASSLRRECEEMPLQAWDDLMGGDAWRADLPLPATTPCRLKRFEHHRDLGTGVVASCYLELECPSMRISGDIGATFIVQAPVFKWRVGFPYSDPHTHATARSTRATVGYVHPQTRRTYLIKDVLYGMLSAPTFRQFIVFLASGERLRALAATLGIALRGGAGLGDQERAVARLVADQLSLSLEARPYPKD